MTKRIDPPKEWPYFKKVFFSGIAKQPYGDLDKEETQTFHLLFLKVDNETKKEMREVKIPDHVREFIDRLRKIELCSGNIKRKLSIEQEDDLTTLYS